MIIKGEFTEKLRRRSQRFYYLYNLLNGVSYMCLGETVIILLAIQLKCRDSVISTIGAMLFYGYLILPLGKLVAAHIGAANSQAVFWAARNVAALFVASAALWHRLGHPALAVAVILSGAFAFYGFRAAGVVMSQPLVGNITPPSERPAFLVVNSILFYGANLVALLSISAVLHFFDGVRPLVLIIVTGSLFGFASCYFIKNISETEALKKAAQGPFIQGLRDAFGIDSVRRQILSGMAMNICISMVIPISMLTIKRGYGLSDKTALLYSIIQLLGSVLAAKLTIPIGRILGAKKMLIAIYLLMVALAFAWLFAPATPKIPFLTALFFLLGAANMAQSNAITNYFLQTIPVKDQVNATILISSFSGFLGALLASIVAGVTLDNLNRFLPDLLPINRYKLYFALVFILLSFGVLAFTRLKEPQK